MFSKKDETKKLSTPDPELTKAAAKGDPVAAALAAEVAKEERHPATAAVMARRSADDGFKGLLRRLLDAGGHDVHCPAASTENANCACAWGGAAAEARAALADA